MSEENGYDLSSIPTRQKADRLFGPTDLLGAGETFESAVRRVAGYGVVSFLIVSDQPFTTRIEEAGSPDGPWAQTQAQPSTLDMVTGLQYLCLQVVPCGIFMRIFVDNNGGDQALFDLSVNGLPIGGGSGSGTPGPQGATGIQGVTGPSGGGGGTTGPQGATGIQGATGTAGAAGATGVQGVTGLAGSQGATGIQGATGAGIQGATGLQGVTGPGSAGAALGVRVYRGASDQSINNNTHTAIIWDGANYNDSSMWNSGVNPSRITVTQTGRYAIVTNALWAGVAGNLVDMELYVNGSLYLFATNAGAVVCQTAPVPSSIVPVNSALTAIVPLTAGDYVEIIVYQLSGGAVNLVAPFISCSLELMSSGSGTDIGAKAFRTTNQSISDNTLTDINLPNTSYDTDNMHDDAVNNERMTIQTSGKYYLMGYLNFASNSAGGRFIRFFLNNTTQLMGVTSTPLGGGLGTSMDVAMEFEFTAGDFITLQAYQTSGGALNVTEAQFVARKVDRAG